MIVVEIKNSPEAINNLLFCEREKEYLFIAYEEYAERRYREILDHENQIFHTLEKIASGKLPKVVELLIADNEDCLYRKKEIIEVAGRAKNILVQGFRTRIVQAMLACAYGKKCCLPREEEFNQKFGEACNKLVRKDFWGTEAMLPLSFIDKLLIDMMGGVNFENPRPEDLKRSELVQYCLGNDSEKKLSELIAQVC